MTRRALGSLAVGLIMFGLTVVAVGLPASGQAPKRGGILNSLLTEDLVQWPHVRNLVPHNSLYSYGRMQEVWLDR
jgi:hypothetical protein